MRHGALSHGVCGVLGVTARSFMMFEEYFGVTVRSLMMFEEFWASRCLLS